MKFTVLIAVILMFIATPVIADDSWDWVKAIESNDPMSIAPSEGDLSDTDVEDWDPGMWDNIGIGADGETGIWVPLEELWGD